MNENQSADVTYDFFQDIGVTPWIVLIASAIPLVLVMLAFKIFPTRRTVFLASIPLVGFALYPLVEILFKQFTGFSSMWIAGVNLVAIIAIVVVVLDALSLLFVMNSLTVQRESARVGSLGNPHRTTILLDNRSWRDLRIEVCEDVLEGIVPKSEYESVTAPKNKRVKVQFALIPHRRGAFHLEKAYVRAHSLLGLWHKQSALACESDVYVYPDIKQIGKYALLARTNRLTQIGVRRTRRIGQDNDFERLRDYQQDDNYKHIDWRTSARRQKLTVKQFQTDQSQRVIFLLDCGRMMTNEYERLSLLDYALNSVLMLSYVALDQGDSVGMITFSDRVHKFVPPSGGKKQMNRILHAGFNQFPNLVQSRFDDAFLYLSRHCRKRSLVVLVTNVIDEVNAQQIQNYMKNLIGSHLPLLVLLRDHRIFDAADNPAPDPAVLYRSAAACQLLVWRDQVIRQMRASGGLALDVFPDEMTSPLVNQYLEVKARHML